MNARDPAPHSQNTDSADLPDAALRFQHCLQGQKAAYLAHPEPSCAERRADLQALARMLKENQERLVEAIHQDYGNRSRFETLFAEFFVVLESIQHTSRHLKSWMKPERRRIDRLMYPGATNRVIPQPLGVVGVIVPWNFPLNLSFCPLAAILAASEHLPGS